MTQKQIKEEILKHHFAMRPGEINEYTKNVYNFLKVKKQTGASAALGTKEIKAREEKELDEWEREIQGIKIRINSIDKEIASP